MRLSGPLRLSGYCCADAGGWFAWLRDAERRGDEERAALVPVALALTAEAPTPRGRPRAPRRAQGRQKGGRGLSALAGQRVTAGGSRPPEVLVTCRNQAAPAHRAKARAGLVPSVHGTARAVTARAGTAGVRTARAVTARAGIAGARTVGGQTVGVRTARAVTARAGVAAARTADARTVGAVTARAGTVGARTARAGPARAAKPGAQAGHIQHAGGRRQKPRARRRGTQRNRETQRARQPQGPHESLRGRGRGEAHRRPPPTARAAGRGCPHQARRADVRRPGAVRGNAGPGPRPGRRSAGPPVHGRTTAAAIPPASGETPSARGGGRGPRTRCAPCGRAVRGFLTRSPPSSLTPRRAPS
jgi:hypothetical protein